MAAGQFSLFLEHVRSFAVGQSIPLRPLTLLVGENSSGKSTLLAIASSVFNRTRFPLLTDFNEPPFSLGNFETIATFKGGKYGRDETFTVGLDFFEKENSLFENDKRDLRQVRATYQQEHGLPTLCRYSARSRLGSLSFQVDADGLKGEASFAPNEGGTTQPIPLRISHDAYHSLLQSQAVIGQVLFSALSASRSTSRTQNLSSLQELARPGIRGIEPVSFAPIRTKPKRTYDELSQEYSPEGDHVPSLLARLLTHQPSSDLADRIRNALISFGAESGLFERVEVRKLGKSEADPFQVQVTVGGPRVNLIDVGYGVSQALPLIVESVMRRRTSLLLIQQPEVHLHPRAQAALGTFFAELASASRNTLVVETHSDHLVDRVRQEVARGTIKPEKVQILFFDRPRTDTIVCPINLDADGNVVNAPDRYRQFFMEEEERLLKRGGD